MESVCRNLETPGEKQNPDDACTCNPCLPQEIIVEIMVRVGAVSVLRFRRVSKLWYSLVSNKAFIKFHSENFKNNPNLNDNYVATIPKASDEDNVLDDDTLQLLPLNSLAYETVGIEDRTITHLTNKERSIVVGCCNGLVCLYHPCANDFFVWNPLTKKSKKLPYIGFIIIDQSGKLSWKQQLSQRRSLKEYSEDVYYLLGLGFDVDISNNDYRVVMICSDRSYNRFVLKVYTLKANCWKIIECGNLKLCGYGQGEGKFLNGKMYWLTNCMYMRTQKIVSFDLESEVLGTLKLPNCGEGHYVGKIDILDECLCVLYRDSHLKTYDLWVMKKYGESKSWTRVAVFSHYFCDPRNVSLYMTQRGEIIFLSGQMFKIYNQKTNLVTPCKLLTSFNADDTFLYIPEFMLKITHEYFVFLNC